MIGLSDAGWQPARIADHLGCSYRTAPKVRLDFDRRVTDALFPRRRGPAPDTARHDHVTGLLAVHPGGDTLFCHAGEVERSKKLSVSAKMGATSSGQWEPAHRLRHETSLET
jgi:hypothetical protein